MINFRNWLGIGPAPPRCFILIPAFWGYGFRYIVAVDNLRGVLANGVGGLGLELGG